MQLLYCRGYSSFHNQERRSHSKLGMLWVVQSLHVPANSLSQLRCLYVAVEFSHKKRRHKVDDFLPTVERDHVPLATAVIGRCAHCHNDTIFEVFEVIDLSLGPIHSYQQVRSMYLLSNRHNRKLLPKDHVRIQELIGKLNHS